LLQAKENREKDKDPTIRYQKFLKNAQQPKGHQIITGMNGGAMTGNSTGVSIGNPHKPHGKVRSKQHTTLPAWMAAPPGE